VNRIDLTQYSDEELNAYITEAQRLLSEREEQRRTQTIEAVRETLRAAGLTAKDLLSRPRKPVAQDGATYRAGYVYRNPENTGQMWAGRGKKPAWLRDLERRQIKPVEARNAEAI
jgi:DNA-binding protein H-NS